MLNRYMYTLIYALLCIILPIAFINMTYGISVIVMFYIPIVIFLLTGSIQLNKPTLIYVVVNFIFSTIMEYLCLYLDIWNFSNNMELFWGFEIFNAPIEEFLWWNGAGILVMGTYNFILGKEKSNTHGLKTRGLVV